MQHTDTFVWSAVHTTLGHRPSCSLQSLHQGVVWCQVIILLAVVIGLELSCIVCGWGRVGVHLIGLTSACMCIHIGPVIIACQELCSRVMLTHVLKGFPPFLARFPVDSLDNRSLLHCCVWLRWVSLGTWLGEPCTVPEKNNTPQYSQYVCAAASGPVPAECAACSYRGNLSRGGGFVGRQFACNWLSVRLHKCTPQDFPQLSLSQCARHVVYTHGNPYRGSQTKL